VQFFGSERDLLVRMPDQDDRDQANLGDRDLPGAAGAGAGVVLMQSNYVGPAVGEELRDDAGLALIAAMA
jgi:preprotein translocase subunit SecF